MLLMPYQQEHINKFGTFPAIKTRQVAWEYAAEFKCILEPKQDVIAFRRRTKKWKTAFGKEMRYYYHPNFNIFREDIEI